MLHTPYIKALISIYISRKINHRPQNQLPLKYFAIWLKFYCHFSLDRIVGHFPMIASFLPLKLRIFVAEGICRYLMETAEIANILLTMVMVHGNSFHLLCITWEQKPPIRAVYGTVCPDTGTFIFSKVLDISQVVLTDSLKAPHLFHFSLLPPTQESYFMVMRVVVSHPHTASAKDFCHIPWIIFFNLFYNKTLDLSEGSGV